MSEVDPETRAWLAARAREAQSRRQAVMAEVNAVAAASDARPARPDEEPMGTWAQEFGPGSARMPDPQAPSPAVGEVMSGAHFSPEVATPDDAPSQDRRKK